MINVSFTHNDITASAMVPEDSPLAMMSKYSNTAEDTDIITILNFLNKSISINDIKNKKDFIEKILYYGAIDLETKISDMMNNRKYNGAIYGQQVYADLFTDEPAYDYMYHMSRSELINDILLAKIPNEVKLIKNNIELDNTCIFTGNLDSFCDKLDGYNDICISQNEYSYDDSDLYYIKIGEYYLYVSEYFIEDSNYIIDRIIIQEHEKFTMLEKILNNTSKINLNVKFNKYGIIILNNFICTNEALYFKSKSDTRVKENQLIIKMLINPTQGIINIYSKYYV